MGYIRYGLYLEVLAGLFLVLLVTWLWEQKRYKRVTRSAALIISVIMMLQMVFATRYLSETEWSVRPTVFQAPAAFVDESKYLLRDRSIRQWLTPEDRAAFDQVDLWIVSGSKTAGLLPFLNRRAPVLGVRSAGIFTMDASRREFARLFGLREGQRIYSLTLPEDHDEALKALHTAGLRAGEPKMINLPFFAPSHIVHVNLFEVSLEKPTQGLR
jgi:hypothetical protein